MVLSAGRDWALVLVLTASLLAAAPDSADLKEVPTALDGHCPVTLVQSKKWQPGDRAHSTIYRGVCYIFAGAHEKELFLDKPDRYALVFGGYDIVRWTEEGKRSLGNRRHGLFFGKQVFLFDSEETVTRFNENPQKYTRK